MLSCLCLVTLVDDNQWTEFQPKGIMFRMPIDIFCYIHIDFENETPRSRMSHYCH